MKVAYVAAFEHSWSTETHVVSDMESLGIDVERITTTSPAEIRASAAAADLVVCQHTGLAPELAGVWEQLADWGVPSCSYHLDLYMGLRRRAQIATDPFWRTGTVFTADGDPATTEALAAMGIKHRWLPAAVVSTETQPGRWRDEYDHDVVFVGSQRYHQEWTWRGELLAFLARRYGRRFKIYDHHPPTRDQDLNDLYATARVVVGDTLALPGHRNFWSDRYYETLGRGGFLIAPWVPGIDAHFTHREHLVFYGIGDMDSVVEQIDEYLEHPDEARKIADEGNAHVRAHHTYRDRVLEMLEQL